jgi:hypothetical protein
MTDEQSEVDRVNRQPLGRHVRNLLLKAGVSPEGGQVHLLQLLQWALDSGQLKVPPQSQGLRLSERLEALNSTHPQEAMDYLLSWSPEEEGLPERELLAEQDPVFLARMVLENLAFQVRLVQVQPSEEA